MAHGYRYGEVKLNEIPKTDPTAKIIISRRVLDPSYRPVVQVAMGMNVEGAVPPHPCPSHVPTKVAGCLSRVLLAAPKSDPEWMGEFKTFVQNWLKKNLVPLESSSDVSLETWLNGTNYSAKRKQELREKWAKVVDIRDKTKKYYACKSFVKDEVYPEYKHARGISSRSDEFKCFTGPYFKLIENVVYKLKYFIKHIPVADRPKYLLDLLRPALGQECRATDFIKFESLFVEALMDASEMPLYEYMTQYLPTGMLFMAVLEESIIADNISEYNDLTTQVEAKRQSGDMCTSLGNGWTNVMAFLFIVEKIGGSNANIGAEGDDGLGNNSGPTPKVEHYEKIGLAIKLDTYTDISEASFCGIIFHPDDGINVTDPRMVMASIGWTTRQYARARDSKLKALLRCKALSYAHQYPGCPIIDAMSHSILRLTRPYAKAARDIIEKQKYYSVYYRDRMLEAFRDEKKLVPRDTGMATRFLVERKFNISVEHQLIIEAYYRNLNQIGPIECPVILWHMDPVWMDYHDKYTRVSDIKSSSLEYPYGTWPIAFEIRKFDPGQTYSIKNNWGASML